MIAIRPALTHFLDSIRGFERAADPKLNAKIDPRIARLQQPVPKVTRLPRQFDAFENSATDQKSNFKQAANFRSATAQPRAGATDITQLHRDGFESATRKPVELAPKPPPSFRAAIPVFRFR